MPIHPCMKRPSTPPRAWLGILLGALLCCASGATGQVAATQQPPAKQFDRITGATSVFPAQIDALLASPAASRAHWGISVVDAGTGAVLYARNDAQLFEPASNAKLSTTAAALALLGPGFIIQTRVVADGTVTPDGKLHGNLRLVGAGDPTLSGRTYPYAGRTERAEPPLHGLDELAAQVAAAGIRSVDGAVIGDDSFFVYERYGTGWAWDDLQWDYGAPVSALTVGDNVRYLTLQPGAHADDLLLSRWDDPFAVPPGPDATGAPAGSPLAAEPIQMLALTSPPGTESHLGVSREVDGGALRIEGSLPSQGKPVHLAIALRDPASFAAAAFAAALAAHGVTVSAASQAVHSASEDTQAFAAESRLRLALQPGVVPGFPAPGGRVLAMRTSPPLSQIVTVVNKVSQNLHAELLLRLLGRAQGDGGSFVQGVRVVRAFLTGAGIDPGDFNFVDGSGLSPQDLITPRATTTLLVYAARQSWGADYRASLPVGGVDGSLAGRFTQPPLLGRVAAKTGSLTGVNTLSGYLTAASGRQLAFSILANDYVGEGGRATIDSVVASVAAAF